MQKILTFTDRKNDLKHQYRMTRGRGAHGSQEDGIIVVIHVDSDTVVRDPMTRLSSPQ